MMEENNKHFSPRATLAAIGLKITALGLLAPIKEKVRITSGVEFSTERSGPCGSPLGRLSSDLTICCPS